MNPVTRKTRACTIDALDEELRAAIRAHAAKFGLEDLEADVLMCCETISVHPRRGTRGGIQTTLSAVYVTPKWLVWADSTGRNDVTAGTAQLNQIDVRDYQTTTHAGDRAITPDQGLNITGQYTDKNRTGITFIVLESSADGQRFRQVLNQTLRKVAVY